MAELLPLIRYDTEPFWCVSSNGNGPPPRYPNISVVPASVPVCSVTTASLSQLNICPAQASLSRTNGTIKLRRDANKGKLKAECVIQRAAAVRDQLVASGISAEKILIEGRGETQPLHPNDSAANQARNRRVDINFLLVDEQREMLPTKPAQVEMRTEEVKVPAAWIKRAMVNPVSHKRRIDVYRFEKTKSTVTVGEKEYVNYLPQAQDDTASVVRNGSSILIDVLNNDVDPDGDKLSIIAVTQPAAGGRVKTLAT